MSDKLTDTFHTYPRITIVTPSFNQGQYIEATIRSVLDQGYPNLEYIIMDGGSTDNTVEVIKKYSDRITYWVSEKDTGQSNAINKGFRMATGDILNWLNSDDLLMPGSLHAVAAAFTRYPHATLIHGRIIYFGDGIREYTSRNLALDESSLQYVSHICMPQPACFMRSTLLKEQGLLDESLHFSMDTDLYMRAGLHYSIVQVDDIFARFRLHPDSKSVSSFNKRFLTDNQKIFSRVLFTINAASAIKKMEKLGLYVPPAAPYNKPQRKFDGDRMLFYFLTHRLYTLFFHRDAKEFNRLFNFLFTNYFSLLLKTPKLWIYRASLWLPKGFLHKLSSRLTRVGKAERDGVG